MIDENRLRAIKNQAKDGREDLREAEQRMKEMLGAEKVSIDVNHRGRVAAHVYWGDEEDNNE